MSPEGNASQRELWLAEYREVMADHRHYEVLRWTIAGLTYPTAFAAAAFAGSRWGFTSGRAALVLALSSLWLIAGSLVFAQIQTIDRARMLRAWELESKSKLDFANVTHAPFDRPAPLESQPWFAQELAWWFSRAVPVAVSSLWVFALVALAFGWRPPVSGSSRDELGLWASVLLLGIASATFFIKVALRRAMPRQRKRS